jgi:hypothetical protein
VLVALLILLAAAGASVLASYLLWWASHRSGWFNFAAGILLGLASFLCVILLGYLAMRAM